MACVTKRSTLTTARRVPKSDRVYKRPLVILRNRQPMQEMPQKRASKAAKLMQPYGPCSSLLSPPVLSDVGATTCTRACVPLDSVHPLVGSRHPSIGGQPTLRGRPLTMLGNTHFEMTGCETLVPAHTKCETAHVRDTHDHSSLDHPRESVCES